MKVRIMSSNIWGDYFGNEVAVREDQLFEVFSKYAPDILGMQEATKSWTESRLFAALREEYTFVDTDAYTDNNYVPLLYKTAAFRCVDSGYLHYEDTPDKSKSLTWAVLESVETGCRFGAVNTHFWWKFIGTPEHDAIRVSNAENVHRTAVSMAEKYDIPVFAFGDLNSGTERPCIVYLKEQGWVSAQENAAVTSRISTHHGDPVRGEDGRFHGKTTENPAEKSIDHIFALGKAEAKEFRLVTDQPALDATDHSPIWCDYEI